MVDEVNQAICIWLSRPRCLVVDSLGNVIVELLAELIPRLRWGALALFELNGFFQNRPITCLHLRSSSSWQVESVSTLDEKADNQEEGE